MDSNLAASAGTQSGPPEPDLLRLLQLARGNDRAAFRQLVARFQARVFTTALRFAGSRTDAEEVAQDVFVQLHRVLGRIVDPAHLEKWLMRVVYHRSIDLLRRRTDRGQKVPMAALDHAPEAQALEPADDPLAASRLHQLLLQLQPDARAVLLLRYQDDLDPPEIAAVLDMPVNTVKSHLRRSLQWLRAQYAGDFHEI